MTDEVSVCRQTENGAAMSGYSQLTVGERDRLADLKAEGLSLRAIARALGRAASTISREVRRNALSRGVYRPHIADGAYMLRRQRRARLETDTRLATYVTDRLTEGWTPEQVAGRLRLGIETGLREARCRAPRHWASSASAQRARPITARHFAAVAATHFPAELPVTRFDPVPAGGRRHEEAT